ncbi:hypothetical protein WDV91_14340 [Curtobacterium flaccumfaciens pv. flaccumfaciens]
MSSTMVSPDTAHTTSTQMSSVASGPFTSHAVLPSVIPSQRSTMLTAPEFGCASSTSMNESVVSPTTYGRKNTVRRIVLPRRRARTSTARKYPSARIGRVTIAVYSSV